ncbi:type III pantothenate kinase [Rhodanobacter sp. L36]|uniref:type III pantothenate kinase n=1 Tax=Rhodanobacter sp. L36 TaxID=1747221 RepID=UPI00131B4D75|nr:type III pantothenate kinase [Rhodanobacter sp. L36]
MMLLLDLGNTRLKWALVSPSGEWPSHGATNWEIDAARSLAAEWKFLPRPLIVVAASVVDPQRESQVEAVVLQLFERQTTWMRSPANACGVQNAYAEPHRLGVDRFLAMVAAKAAGRAPCVLASIGTALTLDALDAGGRHLGGLIAPGPMLMQTSLLDATARVRPERDGDILDLADNTADAVSSGCWQASAALIERFATRMRARLDGSTTLILSGGDADRLLPLISIPADRIHDGVLRGLAVWATTHVTVPSPV